MSLDTQNGFAFLEALTSDIVVQSLGRSFDGSSAHAGITVRPSTSDNIPSSLQLLPGQSFYIGNLTFSLVPEEDFDLPMESSELPDSKFELNDQQVTQISTPHRTPRVGYAFMETPMPHRAQESEILTPILEQITGQAISGRKASANWPQSPSRRQIMQTVRDASEHGHSNPQSEVKKEDELIIDATINEPDHPSSQPRIKTEVKDVGESTAATPMEQGVVDLEDTAMADVHLKSEIFEQLEPLSTLTSQTPPEVSRGSKSPSNNSITSIRDRDRPEFRGTSHSPIPEESKSLPSSIERVHSTAAPEASSTSPDLPRSKPLPPSDAHVQFEKEPEPPSRSPTLPSVSGSLVQLEDHLDGPVRKKTKTTAVSHEALTQESQNLLQDELTPVKRGPPTPTDRPNFTNQVSTTFQTPFVSTDSRSHSEKQPRSPTSPTGPRHLSPSPDSDSRPCPANEPPSNPSIKSVGLKRRTPLSDRNAFSASPSYSVEPNSSQRSTRSSARDEHNSPSLTPAGPRILFASSSSAGDSKPFLKFLSDKKVKKVQSVHDCTVLCVGKELKKTSKLILAVLLGKDVVTDSWVTDSVKANDLLSVVGYLPRDPKKEAEWGISLDEAIYRGRTKDLQILKGQTIIFTPSSKKELGKNGFDELKEIVKFAGAKSVSSTLPKKSPEETPSTIVIGTHDNTEKAELQNLGWTAYIKDIISLSVLRGNLDLESDEFLIKEEKKESRKRKR